MYNNKIISEDESLAEAVRLMDSVDGMAGLHALFPQAMRLLKKGFVGAGVHACRLCAIKMLAMDLGGAPESDLRSYNSMGLTLMELYHQTSCRLLLPVMRLYKRICANALALGDIRAKIMAMLLLGLWAAMRANNGRVRNDFLARALQEAGELGDPDINSLAADCRTLWHATRGELKRCVQSHRGHKEYAGEAGNLYIGTCAAVVAAAASVFTGSIHEGFAFLESRLNALHVEPNALSEHWIRTQLGILLCIVGRLDDAIIQLEKASRCSSPFLTPLLYAFLCRGTAYYHYRRGAINASYRLFMKSATFDGARQARRAYYGYPWLLETLYAYRVNGLPDVPGYVPEDILSQLRHGANKHLKGASRRYEALLGERAGADAKTTLGLLEESLAVLEQVGNKDETVLTHKELARVLRLAGRNDEAARHERMTLAVTDKRVQYGVDLSVLQRHLEEQAVAAFSVGCRCSTMEEYRQFFTGALRSALRCERSALFLPLAHDRLRMAADSNFPLERARPSLNRLGAVIGELRREQLDFAVRDSAFFCLLPDPDQQYWAYADNVYLDSVLPRISGQVLKRLYWIFSTHFQLAASALKNAAPPPMVSPPQPRGGIAEDGISRRVRETAEQVAQTGAPVLLLGETGVGKEVLARHIHAHSGRRGAFVAINPAGMTEGLFESALFGYEKGAFTGADQQKMGLIEAADNGTLFIDEVGDIPLSMQVKLLRVLQEKTFVRVGGIRLRQSDFRIIGATHRDVWRMVQEGAFREDLYYRLAVIPLTIPPLREEPEQIVSLARKFLAYYARLYHKHLPPLDEELAARLRLHSWPGNIRELKNAVERAVILYSGNELRILDHNGPVKKEEERLVGALWEDMPSMADLHERYIRRVLSLTGNRVCGPQGAEAILKMKRSTLYAAIKKYGLSK